jgi:predicted NUDIX family NTP pyrophosphohydrolase
MVTLSAGILLHRRSGQEPEVWLGHMGGPFWVRRPRAWSIPKGEIGAHEDARAAALREFAEEMGTAAPEADYALLGEFRQNAGKIVTVFAAEADFEPDAIASNTFSLEWPKGSGTMREFPEIDEARWFGLAAAREMIVAGQVPILDRLDALLHGE